MAQADGSRDCSGLRRGGMNNIIELVTPFSKHSIRHGQMPDKKTGRTVRPTPFQP
jgi:hypothetical protein